MKREFAQEKGASKSNVTRHVITFFALLIGSAAFAQQPQTPAAGRRPDPVPPLLTMEKKVADANHIFIGTGTRIYFIDRFYKEVPFEQAHSGTPNARMRNAILEVEIDRTLYALPNATAARFARFYVVSSIEPFGNRPSGQDLLSAQYVGKPMIYFSNANEQNIRDYSKEPAPVVGKILLHRFLHHEALKGPTENPLPLSEIQEVMQAVNNRITAESPAKR